MGIIQFPSPLEVYRFISLLSDDDSKAKELFPSPLEVYRFISLMLSVSNKLLTLLSAASG